MSNSLSLFLSSQTPIPTKSLCLSNSNSKTLRFLQQKQTIKQTHFIFNIKNTTFTFVAKDFNFAVSVVSKALQFSPFHYSMDLATFRRNSGETEENSGGEKISLLDHLNGIQYTTEKKSDNFVIDMESFNNGGNKDINNIKSNSRITRSFSRKGSSRGGGDATVPAASSSPRAPYLGPSMPEKAASSPLVVAGTTVDHSISPQVHHQITITTTPSNINAPSDNRFALRRNSFKRPPFSLAVDPKRVLFVFATISSMGTILLIYFTLSMGKYQD